MRFPVLVSLSQLYYHSHTCLFSHEPYFLYFCFFSYIYAPSYTTHIYTLTTSFLFPALLNYVNIISKIYVLSLFSIQSPMTWCLEDGYISTCVISTFASCSTCQGKLMNTFRFIYVGVSISNLEGHFPAHVLTSDTFLATQFD